MGALDGQTAIVTGGTAGIGKAIALKLASEGARVAIFGTNEERGQEVASQLSDGLFLKVDVSNTQEVENAVSKVLEAFTSIDILVNNAGVTRDLLLMKMTEEDWDKVMDINIKSCYNTCHALVRPMMKARKGKIINMGSVVGLMGNAGQVNYAASKAAIVGFSKALAKELAPRNICVNCVAPGFIETRMTGEMTEQQKEVTLSQIPLGRIGQPDDISEAVLYLAQADYVTGQVLVVDGGMVM